MADLRVTGGGSLPTVQPARPSEATRAAQRAFFQAALNNTAPTAAARPVQSPSMAAPTTPVATPTPAADGPQPGRYLRPGSLLDIKV